MAENFEQLLKRLSQDQALFQGVEEATRQGVILPVLHHLDWDTYNIREVSPEYSVGKGRVDYCLQVAGRKVAYLEVKRTTEDLEPHERQLLEYAFTDGVELAVLTNGLLWWLYLPLSRGNWQERKFFTIDIRGQAPDVAAKHFRDFLGRDSIANGTALSQARAAQENKEKDRLILDALSKAWEQLFKEPDELFIELFANKVEGICGYKPELEVIAKFIRRRMPLSSPLPPPITTGKMQGETTNSKATRKPYDPFESLDSGSIIGGSSRQKGTMVQIGTRTFEADSVSSLYEQILRYLCDDGYIDKLRPFLPYATSAKRYLLSTQPVHPRGNDFRRPIEYKGYFLETHKDYQNAIKHMKDLLQQIGLNMKELTS